MATNYNMALKTARMQAIVTEIGTSGFLVIGDSSLSSPSTGVLAKIPLAATAGTVTNDVLTFTQVLPVVAIGTGTAAKAEIWKSTNAVVVSGLTVGTSGANVNLGTISVNTGNTVTVSPATITHAA